MDAEATVAAMDILLYKASETGVSIPGRDIGRDILVSALGHLRRSLREYLTRGGK